MAEVHGNEAVITDFANHLYEEFRAYIARNPVSYVDGMLAIHNVHVNVIEFLVSITGDAEWRQGAKEIFTQRMENPIQPDSVTGFDDA